MHSSADASESDGPYVPGAHGNCELYCVPCGQKWPGAHAYGCSPNVPPVPLWHATRAGHTAQSSDRIVWFPFVNVPAGQGCWFGCRVPRGHQWPAAHACTSAVTIPDDEHAQPAVHGRHAPAFSARSAGLNEPAEHRVNDDEPASQYAPAGHGRHWSPLSSFSAFEYVPAAHGFACADAVPGGQK